MEHAENAGDEKVSMYLQERLKQANETAEAEAQKAADVEKKKKTLLSRDRWKSAKLRAARCYRSANTPKFTLIQRSPHVDFYKSVDRFELC